MAVRTTGETFTVVPNMRRMNVDNDRASNDSPINYQSRRFKIGEKLKVEMFITADKTLDIRFTQFWLNTTDVDARNISKSLF
jgi:hypothetical protein